MDRQIKERDMKPLGFGITGAILGLIGAHLSRPTFFGTPIPLKIAFSSHPNDAQLATQMQSHLALWICGGLVAGIVLAIILQQLAGAQKVGSGQSSSTNGTDIKKWEALKMVDDEIAQAARKAAEFGSAKEKELAEKYLAIGDKAYLPKILDTILSSTSIEPETGTTDVGNFRRASDGSYVMTSGKHIGKTYPNYASLVQTHGDRI